MADRSRRDKKSAADKLAAYKLAREGGGRNYKARANVVRLIRGLN